MQATNDNKYISLLGKHANILFYIFSICYPFHFKYIFKGKKHNKKENTKEVSCLGLIQNQFWPVSAIGRYNLIRSIRPDSGRIGPVRCEFVKKKKKNLRRGIYARAAASLAAPHIGLRCGTLPVASVLPRTNHNRYPILKSRNNKPNIQLIKTNSKS